MRDLTLLPREYLQSQVDSGKLSPHAADVYRAEIDRRGAPRQTYIVHLVETTAYTLTIQATSEADAVQLAYDEFGGDIDPDAAAYVAWNGPDKYDSCEVIAASIEHPDGTHTYND